MNEPLHTNPKPSADLADIWHMPIGTIAEMGPDDLLALLQQADDNLRRAKQMKEWLQGVLHHKYESKVHFIRQRLGKNTGRVRLVDEDVTVVADIPKRVSWDQEKLFPIVERLLSEGWDIEQIATPTLKISERQFQSLPYEICHQLREARTVTLGQEVFTLQAKETETVHDCRNLSVEGGNL